MRKKQLIDKHGFVFCAFTPTVFTSSTGCYRRIGCVTVIVARNWQSPCYVTVLSTIGIFYKKRECSMQKDLMKHLTDIDLLLLVLILVSVGIATIVMSHGYVQ